MNSHYQTVATVTGGNGLQADLHEFQIAPHDVAYITAFNPIRCDLKPARRPRQRRDHRRGDRGDRHEDRPRALGVAQPRPRRRRRVRVLGAAELAAVGLLPPQLDRPRARRRHPDLGAQHVGRVPDRSRQRPDPVAPGRPEELVQDRAGHETAWQHDARMQPDGRDHDLRRRLDPARALPVARRADRARLHDPPGAAGLALHASRPAAARREPGQHADAPGRQHGRRLRRRPAAHASSPRTARCSSTPTCPSTWPPTAASASPGAAQPASPPGARRLPSTTRARRRSCT